MLLIGLTFFISFSLNLSISSVDTIISLKNSPSITFSFFTFLSFNSLSFNSIKSFSNSKRLFLSLKIGSFAYCLGILSQYFPFYNLSFPSLYINKMLNFQTKLLHLKIITFKIGTSVT